MRLHLMGWDQRGHDYTSFLVAIAVANELCDALRVSILRYCGDGTVGGASTGTPGTWFPLANMHCW
jgi:hypothetical protein